jgi:hypothetical protein
MDMEEISQRLENIGCKIINTQVNSRGRHVHLIKHQSGWSVAMFQEDAADFVSGRSTLEEIIARNRGADLADPWPISEQTD